MFIQMNLQNNNRFFALNCNRSISKDDMILKLQHEIKHLKRLNQALSRRAPRKGISILLDENNSGCELLRHHTHMLKQIYKMPLKQILNGSYVFGVTDKANYGRVGGAMPRKRLLRKTRSIGVPNKNVISCQKHRFSKPEVQTDDAVLGAYVVAKASVSTQVHVITNDGDSAMEIGGPQPIILKVEEAAKENPSCSFLFVQWEGQKFSKSILDLCQKYTNINHRHWKKPKKMLKKRNGKTYSNSS